MRKILLGAATAAMVLGGSIAHAAPASAEGVRSSSNVEASESLAGGELVAVLIGAAALVFALVQINDSDTPDLPVSP